MQSSNNNNNNMDLCSENSHDDDSELEMSLAERVAELAARKREAEKVQNHQALEMAVQMDMENIDTNGAANKIVGEIQDLELRDKSLKILQDKVVKDAKDRDHELAQLATAIVAGDLCINLLRGNRQCTRPADPDPRYGDMCRQCCANRRRKDLSKLSPNEKYLEKRKNFQLKRERDAEAAEEKERHVEMERQKREKKRARKLLLKKPRHSVVCTPSAPPAREMKMHSAASPMRANSFQDQHLVQVAERRFQPMAAMVAVAADENQHPNMQHHQQQLYEQQPQFHVRQQSKTFAYDQDSDDSFGLDLFSPNFEDEINAMDAEEAAEDENDEDYRSDDMDMGDEEVSSSDKVECCSVCLEDANLSNSFGCDRCGAIIHHYAHCIKDHKITCPRSNK